MHSDYIFSPSKYSQYDNWNALISKHITRNVSEQQLHLKDERFVTALLTSGSQKKFPNLMNYLSSSVH
jgi:hypothetical protein